MKKSLVLAMAMALGVTASAYAANPFSDVPAGHWAYDSVNKDVDKLAAEFADELDTLGVRVANLEKKADNVKVTGEVRYRYQDSDLNGNDDNSLRSRIWITGQVNDDWSYTGMIQNTQDFQDDDSEESDTRFQRAYLNGKLGGLYVTAGRYNAVFGDGNIYDDRVDGVEVTYGSNVKVTGFAGKATDPTLEFGYEGTTGGDYAGGVISADIAKGLNLAAGYVNFKDMVVDDSDLDNAIWHVGATYNIGDVTASAMYLKGDMSYDDHDLNVLDDDGYVIGLSYKGAQADEVGSWGLWAKYYDQGGQTYVGGNHTTDANYFDFEGFKGYGVCASYTFAKNIVGNLAWYDTESKTTDKDDQRLVADLYFTF